MGVALKKMSISKAVPKGLKSSWNMFMVVGVRTLPFDILEQYPIQEALETKHQPTTCKLTLPSVRMQILRRASRDP